MVKVQCQFDWNLESPGRHTFCVWLWGGCYHWIQEGKEVKNLNNTSTPPPSLSFLTVDKLWSNLSYQWPFPDTFSDTAGLVFDFQFILSQTEGIKLNLWKLGELYTHWTFLNEVTCLKCKGHVQIVRSSPRGWHDHLWGYWENRLRLILWAWYYKTEFYKSKLILGMVVNDHQEAEQYHTLLLGLDSAPRCVRLRMCMVDHQFGLNKAGTLTTMT